MPIRDNFAFLDPDNYETVELSEAMIGDAKIYLVANGKVEVTVRRRPPGDRGPSLLRRAQSHRRPGRHPCDTASNVQKSVTCETGLVVSAPLFIKNGDVIRSAPPTATTSAGLDPEGGWDPTTGPALAAPSRSLGGGWPPGHSFIGRTARRSSSAKVTGGQAKLAALHPSA